MLVVGTGETIMRHRKIICGDCTEVMKQHPDNFFDAIVTDPPYGLEFMGKDWDKFGIPPGRAKRLMGTEEYDKCWRGSREGSQARGRYTEMTSKEKLAFQEFTYQWGIEALRVCKPGAIMLVFGGTRTYHRLTCAIEDAGWQIRDCLMWLYATGFPKSLNIKKSLQKKHKCGNMEAYEEAEQKTKHYLRPVWEADISQAINSEKKQGEILQSGLQEQSLYGTVQREEPPKRTQGKAEPSVEGRGYIETSQRELQRCKVCALSERLFGDGKEGWICNGTPFGYGTPHWSSTPANRSCSSHRPQAKQQCNTQSNVVPNKPSPQEIRGLIEKWNGYGTALKPAWEPIVVAMKPLDGTFAANAEKWGVAGLNINGGRVGTCPGWSYPKGAGGNTFHGQKRRTDPEVSTQGRWPANLILDEEAATLLDQQTGELKSGAMIKPYRYTNTGHSMGKPAGETRQIHRMNSGGASRFFYCAKASRSEREAGLKGYIPCAKCGQLDTDTHLNDKGEEAKCVRNNHPTVKSLGIMSYLCKLLRPPTTHPILLDPFCGSGTTLMAAINTGWDYEGIDKEEDYCKIARRRIWVSLEKILKGD